ncbi:hypothetical protein DY000_02011345 [Brassica cretica]|uniref:Uncharacterized protein n=1 Tax=Brassica cretica TaxID=69181 RepID=A0ABQ7DBH9_BRACR|nr:hypothetical protein DY000_02011345 [Brassica cretica]
MSIPKNIQIPRIAEAIRGVQLTVDVLYDQSEWRCEDWTGPARWMAELVACSIQLADGRAGRVVDPARPSAELDWFSWSCGQAGRVVDSARPSAELDGVLCPPFNKTGITYATRC